ncbi:MAG TPA: 2-hydroxychromene-2-carboxylate isomerase [Afipia sp.]
MADIQFVFDFTSPNCYFAHVVLPGIEARTGKKFEYVPVLLGGIFRHTGNQSPVFTFANVKNKLEYEKLETQRFIAHHNIGKFRNNPTFPISGVQLMRVAIAAQQLGVFETYCNQIFADMWERERKIDDPAIFQASLEEAKLPAKELIELGATSEVKARLGENTQNAFERGAFGAPTFFIGREMFFGKDRLAQVEDEINKMK